MFPKDNPNNWQSGQGYWQHILKEDWSRWRWQMQNRLTSIKQIEEYFPLTAEEKAGCLFSKEHLNLAITPYFFNLIDKNDPNCPIRLQVIPRIQEQTVAPEEKLDPLCEEKTSPVENLVHRYPDRVLLLVTAQCASYCRYCTRSRIVSEVHKPFVHDLEPAFDYIETHTEIRDVLISGGDPLLLNEHKLDEILARLRRIPHIEFIRIGSRVPVFLPQRITPELCGIFKKQGPIWLSIHVNHPRECTQELKDALEKLSYAGVVLGNQSVLLKGVNDDATVMKSLVHRLLQMRVRPYYLYQCDPVIGTKHFRTPIQTGIDIIHSIRGYTSGYAVPQYVVDSPNGGGKIPINPNYIQEITQEKLMLKNFEDKITEYPL